MSGGAKQVPGIGEAETLDVLDAGVANDLDRPVSADGDEIVRRLSTVDRCEEEATGGVPRKTVDRVLLTDAVGGNRGWPGEDGAGCGVDLDELVGAAERAHNRPQFVVGWIGVVVESPCKTVDIAERRNSNLHRVGAVGRADADE